MKDILGKMNYIFDRKQKRRLSVLLAALFIGAILELMGVSLFMPLVSLISKPGMIYEDGMMHRFYTALQMTSPEAFF